MPEALPPTRRLELFVLLLAVCLFGVVEFAVAHNNPTQASTDPVEVQALNSMFERWRILADQNQWNKSGEPCSGDAINRDIDWENTEHNPFIKCDCTYESNTLCHVTQLKVYAMNVVGELPHELYTLTYLTHVELYRNRLTGLISPSIGNLTRLQHLHVGINALSGELPRELGMLSDMSFLGIESNNFSGPLPSELSGCRNLREFWMDSSGITGKIPPSFANLRDMRLLVASDTQLTGRIPEFIGNWTHLTTLRFQGNAFEGPIPVSFSKLTSLEELRISDLSNGSSSLAFIHEMRSLSILELRNNNISDSIPLNIGEYQDLRNLDLSFNNINGHIPNALFNLSRLTLVSLSKNKLSGILPAAKSSTLLNIDVSQNNLAGSLPSWTNEGNLQPNLAGNNFTREGFNSATPNLNATVSNNPPSFTLNSTRGNQTGMIMGIVVGVVAFILLSVLIIFYVLKRRKQLAVEDEELIELDAKPYMFSYAELRTATEDFSSGNKLGEGGFGPVYKGKLSAGREIAVKQLSIASHQGKSQFVAEIATISEVQHRNLVRLYGCCIAGTKKLLVYEYLENKSLDQALFEKSSLKLDWPIRFGICLGVARGLAYLHEESTDLVPKISDFGLAKLYDDKKTHISTRVAGTIGYLAPEYAMRGHLTEKTDVFAFGVMALEVVSGRPNLDTSLEEDKIYLLEGAWNLHENNQEVELVDSKLSDFNKEDVKRLIEVALLCTQTMLSLRPPMSRVVAMLSGDIEVPQVSSRPVYLTGWRFDDPTTSFMSAVTVQGTDANSLINSSRTTETDHLSKNASKQALHDLIGDDR